MANVFLAQNAAQYLKSELQERKERRPLYSLRAFARDLQLSPSVLSDVMNGRLGLSKARVKQIAKSLNIQQNQIDHLNDLFQIDFSRSKKNIAEAQIRIKLRLNKVNYHLYKDEFAYISDWHHLAILELLSLDNQKYNSISKIAKSLKLSPLKVKNSLELLLRLKLIKVSENFYCVSEEKTTVGENVKSEAIQKFHKQFLNLAQNHVSDSIETKNFSSVFLNIRKEDLNEIKEEINRFQSELFEKFYYKEGKNALYGFAIQLFKLVDAETVSIQNIEKNKIKTRKSKKVNGRNHENK